MNEKDNPTLRPYAQKLRREMTDEEKHLWYDFLRSLPLTVNRQKVIGPYIVDFYIATAKLVIELDGSQHFEKEAVAADRKRDQYMNKLGLRVLRFTNLDISRNFRGVCEEILKCL